MSEQWTTDSDSDEMKGKGCHSSSRRLSPHRYNKLQVLQMERKSWISKMPRIIINWISGESETVVKEELCHASRVPGTQHS